MSINIKLGDLVNGKPATFKSAITQDTANVTLIGRTSKDYLINKDLTDASNKVAATSLNIGNQLIKITSSGNVGDVLTLLSATTASFAPVSGNYVTVDYFNTYVNQTITTTSTPVFGGINLSGQPNPTFYMQNGYFNLYNATEKTLFDGQFGNIPQCAFIREFVMYGDVPAGGTADVFSHAPGSDISATLDFTFTAITTPTGNGYGAYHYLFSMINISGISTNGGALYSDKIENNPPFPNTLGISGVVSGPTFILRLTNSGSVNVRVAGTVKINFCPSAIAS